MTMWKAQLDEALEDDGQVVTYKWLSRTAHVPANSAKQMLFSYRQGAGKGGSGLKALYLVAGVARRGDATEHRFVVVPEDKLEAAKAKFERITSEHIYSLQRSIPKDVQAALFQVDMPAAIPLEERNRWGTIQCSKMKRKDTLAEVSYADDGGAAPASSAKSFGLHKATSKPKGKKVDAAAFFGTKAISASKKEKVPVAKAAASEPKKASDGKKKLKRKVEVDDDDEDDDAAAGTSGKAAEPAAEASPKSSSAPAAESSTASAKSKADGDKEAKKSKAKKGESKSKASSKGDDGAADASKGEKRKAKKCDSADEVAAAGSPKKRKTTADIVVPEDSPKQASISDALASAGALKKRTRTVIRKEQRTFMNDKGYMVTETVEVEEEEEVDDEPEPAPAKSAVPAAKGAAAAGKKAAPAKQKQGSLLSFFKKK